MRCIGGHSEQQIIRGENRFFCNIAPMQAPRGRDRNLTWRAGAASILTRRRACLDGAEQV
jgi:hypothetical protein